MPVLTILIVVGLIILWFLLSPLFSRIGSFVYKLFTNATTEEINNKEEKEQDDL